jgi:hypothetical protein
MEATVNVQAFKELKRVLSNVPEGQLDMTSWNSCACGHATRDEWFRSQGLTTCTDFPTAAAFFEITRAQAEALLSGRNGRCVTATQVIENIDQLLARPGSHDDGEVARNARRQAVIDSLLVKANKAAQKARRGVTTLMAIFF